MTTRFRIGIIIAVIAVLTVVGVVIAQSVLHEEQITGIGTITVEAGGGGGGGGGGETCGYLAPVYDFEPSVTTVDFSGSIASGGQYTCTKTISVTNTGTNGKATDCNVIPATINGMTATTTDLLSGWVLTSGNLSGFPIGVGGVGTVDLTLTGPAAQADSVVLNPFTITLSGS